MRRFVFSAIAVTLLGAAAAVAGIGSGDRVAGAQGLAALTPIQQRLVSGFARATLEQRTPSVASASRQATSGEHPTSLTGCPVNRGSNVRVNQDCLNLSRPRPAGSRAGAERDRDRAGPEQPRRT